MPQFNVKSPRQNDYDDDIDEIVGLRGDIKTLEARLARLEKARTTPTTTTQTVISNGGGGGSSTPGQDGQDGAAATIEIGEVTTVASGEPATVENVGTTNAAILDFAIPQGPQGEPGPAGEDGQDGEDGEAGPPGDGMSFAYQSLGAADPLVFDADSDYELILQSFTGSSHAITLPASPIDKLVSVVNYNSTPDCPLTVTAYPDGDYVLPSYGDRALFSQIFGAGWRLVSLTVAEEAVGGGITGINLRRNNSGTTVGPRPRVNINDTNGISTTINDDAIADEIDLSIGLNGYSSATSLQIPRKSVTANLLEWFTLAVFGAKGFLHSTGLVPDPGTGTSGFTWLCDDATWKYPERMGSYNYTTGLLAFDTDRAPQSYLFFGGASTGFAENNALPYGKRIYLFNNSSSSIQISQISKSGDSLHSVPSSLHTITLAGYQHASFMVTLNGRIILTAVSPVPI